MTTQMLGQRMRALSVVAVSIAAVLSAGCAADNVEEGDLDEPQIDVQNQALANCCSWGAYQCKSTGESYDYDPPRCGLLTKPGANALCKAHCPEACKDTGWYSSCDL